MAWISRLGRGVSNAVKTGRSPADCRAWLGQVPRRWVRAAGGGVSAQTAPQAVEDNAALYDRTFRRSLDDPEEFWAEQADALVWNKKWDKVLDDSNSPFTKWFVGGEMNTCYNAVDRHVDSGYGHQVAIIHDSPVTNAITKITFEELQKEVAKFAGVLSKHGVGEGDCVLIYMPMIAEAIVAMLATVRLGAHHSLVFGGFASKELSVRINHACPKVIVSANCGVEPGRVVLYKPLLDAAIKLSEHKPQSCLIYNRLGPLFSQPDMEPGRDFCYREEMAFAKPHDCVPTAATDPVYVLYTSGTTGTPKAVVRPSGGHAVVLNWSMKAIYDINPGEVWCAASDLGWVVGHSYIAYAPLLHRNTTVIFEGKPVGSPDAGSLFRMINQHNIVSLFTAPTALRAIRREDPHGILARKHISPCFRNLFLAGEHCDHETLDWARETLGVPVLDHWWQTETGFAITATCVGLGNDSHPPAGVAGKPVPGWDVRVLNEDRKETAPGELGRIVVKLPLPPASFSTLYKSDDRFKNVYFSEYEGYYDTMDAGYVDVQGNIAVMARADDVINVAGHRLSSGHLEEAILEHDDLAEAAVVGVPDKLKGHIPLGVCVLKSGITKKRKVIAEEVVKLVRDTVGPVAALKQVAIVQRLPKTRSGKVARNTIASMAAGQDFVIPTTIEDANVYYEVDQVLRSIGFRTGQPENWPDIEEPKKNNNK